jgi:hypothetical protein
MIDILRRLYLGLAYVAIITLALAGTPLGLPILKLLKLEGNHAATTISRLAVCGVISIAMTLLIVFLVAWRLK